MQQIVSLLQILLLAQHVSGTIMPIIRSSRVLYRWLPSVVFGALVFKSPVWCRAEGYVSGLQDAAASRKPDTTFSSTPDQQLENHRQQPQCVIWQFVLLGTLSHRNWLFSNYKSTFVIYLKRYAIHRWQQMHCVPSLIFYRHQTQAF